MKIKNNYCKTPNQIVSARELSFGARILWIHLSSYAWGEKDSAWPTRKRMADTLGSTKGTITRLLAELETKGYIFRDYRPGGRTRYKILTPWSDNALVEKLTTKKSLTPSELKEIKATVSKARKKAVKVIEDFKTDYLWAITKPPAETEPHPEIWASDISRLTEMIVQMGWSEKDLTVNAEKWLDVVVGTCSKDKYSGGAFHGWCIELDKTVSTATPLNG